ncbi:hypothetical protein JCM11641_003525 [Rhodosporidiobolus odoratus]
MASSSALSTSFEDATVTSLVPTVTGTTTFVVVDPNAVSYTLLTETLRGQTVTRSFAVTGATVTTTSELQGTSTSLIETSTPVETIFTTVSASSSSVSSTASSSTPSSTSTTSTTSSSISSSSASSATATSSSAVTTTVPPSSRSLSSSAQSSSASSTSAGASSDSSSGSPSNLGAIIGGAVGGAAGLALIALLIWYFAKKSSRRKHENEVDFFAQHGDNAWNPAAVAGGAALGAGGAGLAARRSNRLTRNPSRPVYAGGPGGSDEEKAGFAVLPQKKKLAPADEQDAYYANLPSMQRQPSDPPAAPRPVSQLQPSRQGGVNSGAPSLPPVLPSGGEDNGAGMAGVGAAGRNGLGGAGGGFAGVGANGRGQGAGAGMGYPSLLGAASFDPRARDGGYAVANDAYRQSSQYNQQPQPQQRYPPYPPAQGYPQQQQQQSPPTRSSSFNPTPNSSTQHLLPASIAYNPPTSSFRGPTDHTHEQHDPLAPPSSSRFAAFNSPSHHQPQPSQQQQPLPQGVSSPVPSYRSIPQLGAVGRVESDSDAGTLYGGHGGRGPGGAGGSGALRVANFGAGEEEEDPYGGLDEGLESHRR